VHVDLWVVAEALERAVAASSVQRRLSALSSFYRYCAAHDVVEKGVHRRVVASWSMRTTPPPSGWTVGVIQNQFSVLPTDKPGSFRPV
jgi:hypothetical protein